MSTFAEEVGALVGCNVAGRLRHIRSLLQDMRGLDAATVNTRQSSVREIDELLKFIDPPEETHTPNGWDPLWVEAINHVLQDRGVTNIQITDISDKVWDRFIGPMIDAIEDGQVEVTKTETKGQSK